MTLVSALIAIFFLLLITLILLQKIIVQSLLRRSKALPQRTVNGQYEAVPLLTSAEQSFFRVLQQATAAHYTIFAKVRLADVVHPTRNLSRSGWQSAFNRTACKHVDFILSDPQTLRIITVIELDDSTHGRFERGVRDALVDAALASAGIPVLRVQAARSYSLAQIRQEVENLVRSGVRATDHGLIKA